jgi:uncharacterized membrane protein
MLVLWGVLRLVPSLDPRRENIEKFRDSYETLIVAIIGMMLVLHVAVVGAALGWPIPIVRVVPFVIGTLFIVLGNLLPRFRSNFFLGIRTPWTLSNERVWARTHRVGGYVMVVAGLLMIVSVFVPSISFFPVMFTSIMVAAIGTVLYSYVVWREETRKS